MYSILEHGAKNRSQNHLTMEINQIKEKGSLEVIWKENVHDTK